MIIKDKNKVYFEYLLTLVCNTYSPENWMTKLYDLDLNSKELVDEFIQEIDTELEQQCLLLNQYLNYIKSRAVEFNFQKYIEILDGYTEIYPSNNMSTIKQKLEGIASEMDELRSQNNR